MPKAYTTKIVSEYDQKIPQSQTADKPTAPRGRVTTSSRTMKKRHKIQTVITLKACADPERFVHEGVQHLFV